MHRAPRALCTAASTAALAVLGACTVRPVADTGLNKDLALADQLQRLNAPALVVPRDTTTPAAAPAQPVVQPAPVATRTVTRTVVRTVARAHAPTVAGLAAQPRVAQAELAHSPAPPSTVRPSAPEAGTYNAPSAAAGEVASAGPSAPVDPVTTQPGALPVEREPRTHGVRDGVLASVAGAIIGAAASPHDRVRGGLIGAVAGGALGAVYGRSADRSYPAYSAYGPPSYRTYSGLRRYPTYRGGY